MKATDINPETLGEEDLARLSRYIVNTYRLREGRTQGWGQQSAKKVMA